MWISTARTDITSTSFAKGPCIARRSIATTPNGRALNDKISNAGPYLALYCRFARHLARSSLSTDSLTHPLPAEVARSIRPAGIQAAVSPHSVALDATPSRSMNIHEPLIGFRIVVESMNTPDINSH